MKGPYGADGLESYIKNGKKVMYPGYSTSGTRSNLSNWEDDYYGVGTYKLHTCKHWRSDFKVGDYTIWFSGSMDSPSTAISGWDTPDLAFYLSSNWLSKMGGVAVSGVDSPITPWWPFVLVDWPDYSTIPDSYYKALVDMAIEHLEEGKQLEVACMGGHGRTGTLLAGILAKVENLGAKEALKEIRSRACKNSIETYGQEDMVYRLLGEEPPPLPAKVESKVNTSGTTTGTASSKLIGELQRKAADKNRATKPCICGHPKSRHRGRSHCNLCACAEYNGRQEAFTNAAALGIDEIKKLPGVTVSKLSTYNQDTKKMEYQHRVVDIETGEIFYLPIVEETIGVSDKPALQVCLCGHLETTHQYRPDKACAFCNCTFFTNSDNYSDEAIAKAMGTYVHRTPEEVANSYKLRDKEPEQAPLLLPAPSGNTDKGLVGKLLTESLKDTLDTHKTGWGME